MNMDNNAIQMLEFSLLHEHTLAASETRTACNCVTNGEQTVETRLKWCVDDDTHAHAHTHTACNKRERNGKLCQFGNSKRHYFHFLGLFSEISSSSSFCRIVCRVAKMNSYWFFISVIVTFKIVFISCNVRQNMVWIFSRHASRVATEPNRKGYFRCDIRR